MNTCNMLSKETVLAAIKEIDMIGDRCFLKEYGLDRSRDNLLRDQNTRRVYDTNAIVLAVCHLVFLGKPLKSRRCLKEGASIVKNMLIGSGFEVVRTQYFSIHLVALNAFGSYR